MTKLNPKFDDLSKPETIKNHLQELTKTKATPHDKILSQLLEQVDIVDFEALANPRSIENFKITQKHYSVLAVQHILEIAAKNKWGLCKHHDFIFLFNGSYWSEIDKNKFQKFLGDASGKMGVPEFTSKYHKFRKDLLEQFLAVAYLEQSPPSVNNVLINLQNGTFEVNHKGTQLRPFDRKDFLTYQLPFKYDQNAKAPIFEKYLNKVLPDVERQKVLAEFLGFVFIRNGSNRMKEEKALILYGTGANGKSVFFDIVSALLGAENTSNYSLQDLTNENGYYRAKIANKLVNYSSEINGKLESSLFKQLVSGEPVSARLPYGQPFTLKNYAKLIFNSNELPKDVEHTNAYFRRFLIIPFDVTISDAEKDTELSSKIIESELSGVFNWVLEGLNRLLTQTKFSKCNAAQQALEQYKLESDSVQMFLNDNEYQSSSTDYKLIKDIYAEYKSYCIEDGNSPFKKQNFIKQLKRLNITIDTTSGRMKVAYLSKARTPF
jgi:putative DNA primase/helicase